MFSFFAKTFRKRHADQNVMDHNKVDASVMSRFLGMAVLKSDFIVKEDYTKILATGVTWRRRRFNFRVEDAGGPEPDRPEGLCINEISLDSNAAAEIRPALASEFHDLLDLSEIENAYWATTFAKGAIRQSVTTKETRLYLNMGSLYYGPAARNARVLIHDLNTLQKKNEYDEELLDRLEVLDPELVPMGDGKFGVVRYLPAFPVSRLVQSSSNILAAINAGYFLNFPEEYEDGISALHQPLGGHAIEGRLVAPPWVARPGILHLKSGKTISRIFGPSDLELCIEGLQPVPLTQGILEGPAHGKVWRFFDSESFSPPPDAIAVSFTGSLLVAIEPARADMKPPRGGATVWLLGDHAREAMKPNAASRISLRLTPQPEGEVDWMVSAGPFLVRNGGSISADAMFLAENAGEFRPLGPAPTRFPFDAEKTRAPRTAMGSTSSGGFKLVVVDGRRSGEHSCGLTLDGLAKLMQWVGCESAINLDGGGSSVMGIEGTSHAEALSENSPHSIVNIPSDDGGRERIVPIFLTVKGSPNE